MLGFYHALLLLNSIAPHTNFIANPHLDYLLALLQFIVVFRYEIIVKLTLINLNKLHIKDNEKQEQ